jgi:RNA polymerase sigma-70 factor (ECF subfamily)
MERSDNLGLSGGPGPVPASASVESLLRAFQRSGEGAALGALYERVAPVLVAAALPVTRDRTLAEDAVHEAFLDLYAVVKRYDAALPALPWLVGIVRRKALKIRRNEARRVVADRLPRPTLEDGAAAAGRGAPGPMDSLTGPYRAVARLRWQYDLSPREIADLRGERPGTTRSLLSRALAQMRRVWDCSAVVLLALGVAGRWLLPWRVRQTARVATSPATAAAGGHGVLSVAFATVLGGCAAWIALDTLNSAAPLSPSAAGSARAEPLRLIHTPRPLTPAEGESPLQNR